MSQRPWGVSPPHGECRVYLKETAYKHGNIRHYDGISIPIYHRVFKAEFVAVFGFVCRVQTLKLKF